MHKRIVNQATVEIAISPFGPILIKAGDQGADPTKPDMEFVETYHAGDRSVYLPGSSLKGAIRSHCERIIRTIGGEQPSDGNVWTCDPLSDDKRNLSCSKRLDGENNKRKEQRLPVLTGAEIHASSCTACQLFGNSSIASRFGITDAYPELSTEIQMEERNGVAIDRIYGSAVRGALFNFQVLTEGKFTAKITLKNFTTAQLALIALAIRDFDEQRVSIGFAKSRGLGQISMKVKRVEIHYPTAVVENSQLRFIGQTTSFDDDIVVGAGQLVDEKNGYGFPSGDSVNTEVPAKLDDFGLGATLSFNSEDNINALWRGCVIRWREMVKGSR